ncbi:MAG: gas vesicle protein GvpG [Terriglobia bacterium]|jgi:hypothetical protein
MVLVDDLLKLPITGLVWIARQVQNAAQEELANESESVTAELSQLYMMLETGKISEEEFAAGEGTLLERLDRIQERDRDLKEEDGGAQEQEHSEMRRVA